MRGVGEHHVVAKQAAGDGRDEAVSDFLLIFGLIFCFRIFLIFLFCFLALLFASVSLWCLGVVCGVVR